MVEPTPSKNAIDRLGGRLRFLVTPDDLRMLDTYRLSFASAYEVVLQQVRITYGLEVSGRPAKSTTAIVDKLNRESIRLSQMQDMAGCRIVVADIAAQNALSAELQDMYSDIFNTGFSRVSIVDRRTNSSHGYRAVHLVVHVENYHIEIQIRTQLQQLWAEVSEKLADIFGIDIKYGGGADSVQPLLISLTESISFIESTESLELNTAMLSELEALREKIRHMLLRILEIAEE